MPIPTRTIKFISSLRQKKIRQNYHKFTVEGPRIVSELLAQQRYRVDHVYALPTWIGSTAPPSDIPLTTVSPKELGRISQLSTPNQVVAVVNMPDAITDTPADLTGHWSLYLDGLQSPSNLGAMLRIADWFGFRYVFGGPGTADLYNTKTLQASMGSFLRTDYRTAVIDEIIATAPDFPVFAADLDGDDIYTITPPPAGMLVIGAEGRGLGAGTQVHCNRRIHIPKATGGGAESLNAAVATGILCAMLRKPSN